MVSSYYMNPLVAIILGLIEGATEFIPVSSTGHLIIVREIFGINEAAGLSFDAVLQLATTLALIVYFWKDILDLIHTFFDLVSKRNIDGKDKVLFFAILIGTIPAVIFGLLLENQMATAFRNVNLVAITLILGSGLFALAQYVSKSVYQSGTAWSPNGSSVLKPLSIAKGITIGFFQVLALFPGISRSGATISGGLLTGLSKDDAVRFSFLLSIPILLGSGLKKLIEIRHDVFTTGYGTSLLLGSVVAFVVGLLSIRFLIKYLKNHDLNFFIYYRIALSMAIFLLF